MRNSNLLLRYPIKMKPTFKDYIWGGKKLKDEWNKDTPYIITAESWELSAHKNGESYALHGPLKGLSLNEIIEKLGISSLGINGKSYEEFPILIKLIDANNTLSVQVHPDDEFALKHENSKGKTEIWHVADASADAFIYLGFKKDMTVQEFRKSIENNTCTDYLNKVQVKKGDTYLIEAGTVHAIGKGCIIAEIQQSSDITYRVYDFARKDKNNKLRELHIDKACQVAKLKKTDVKSTSISQTKYFETKKYNCISNCILDANEESFHSLLFLEGQGHIIHNKKEYSFIKGDCFFVPSKSGEYKIFGKTSFLLTKI